MRRMSATIYTSKMMSKYHISSPVPRKPGSQEAQATRTCVKLADDGEFFLNVPIPSGALLTLTGLLDTRTSSARLDIIGGRTGALAYGNFSESTGNLSMLQRFEYRPGWVIDN